MKICAIVLSWKREKNIPFVVEGLKKQSFIDDILIFHNSPASKKIPDCINIVSELNLGCMVRHSIADLLDYDYFVFSDDDFCLRGDLTKVILPYINSHGSESVLGFFGRELAKDSAEPYTSGKSVTTDTFKPVDIVKGRFYIMSKRSLRALAESEFNTKCLRSEDDIRANVTCQYYFEKPSYLLPFSKEYVEELPEPHALHERSFHNEYRDTAVTDAIKFGWTLHE